MSVGLQIFLCVRLENTQQQQQKKNKSKNESNNVYMTRDIKQTENDRIVKLLWQRQEKFEPKENTVAVHHLAAYIFQSHLSDIG